MVPGQAGSYHADGTSFYGNSLITQLVRSEVNLSPFDLKFCMNKRV